MHSLRPAFIVWLTLRLTIITGLDHLHSPAKSSGLGSRAPRVLYTKTNNHTSVRSRETSPSRKHRRYQDSVSAHITPFLLSTQRHSPLLPCSYYVLRRLARRGCGCFSSDTHLVWLLAVTCNINLLSISALSQKNMATQSHWAAKQGLCCTGFPLRRVLFPFLI